MACLRGRQSSRGAGWQARAAVCDLFRDHVDAPAHPRGAARDSVQRQCADGGGRGVAVHHRLSGAGRTDAAAGARSRDRSWSHGPRGVARIRLRRRRVSGTGHECILQRVGRDLAAALVHGGATRTGGAWTAARGFCTGIRGTRLARGALLLARASASAVIGEKSGADGGVARAARGRRAARRRRGLRRGVAARARAARRLHSAGDRPAGLRHLLPAALSQPDPAQDPDCGRRQRPERAQSQNRRNSRGEAFAVVGIPPETERDVLKGTAVHIPIYADATYLFIFRTTGSGIAVAINTLSSDLAAGGARTDGSLVKAALASASPADILLQPIFNPVGGYASYVVPAAFVLILQQMLLIGASMLTVVA